MEKVVNLTRKEFEKIINPKRKLGSGYDGTVYGVNLHTVYKIYHKKSDCITIIEKGIYDSEDINIRSPKTLNNCGKRENRLPINYIDDEGVTLSKEAAIIKAIEKQQNVHLTYLPQQIVKLDGRFVGCAYKRYHTLFSIYAASFRSPENCKRILKRLFLKIKELHENYIYPITLVQKNPLLPFSRKNANVLLGTTNSEPYLIDLDGISAYYFDRFSESFYRQSLSSLSILILEVLSGIDFIEPKDEFELEWIINSFVERGIPRDWVKECYDYHGVLDEEKILHLLK